MEQENNHFYHKNRIFWNFIPLGHPEDSNIFENFFLFFGVPTIGQLLVAIRNHSSNFCLFQSSLMYNVCQWHSNLLCRLCNAHGPLAVTGTPGSLRNIFFFLLECNKISLTKVRQDVRNTYSIALTLCLETEV